MEGRRVGGTKGGREEQREWKGRQGTGVRVAHIHTDSHFDQRDSALFYSI
jgi:hypothetical protein